MNACPTANELEIPIIQLRREVINPLSDAGWNDRLPAHSESSIFHSSQWAGVLHETYGYTPFYFCIFNGKQLRACLPVMELNSRLTGKRGVSLPFSDECPPLATHSSDYKILLNQAMEFGKDRSWKSLECRGGKAFVPHAPASLTFYRHRLDLSPGEAWLFSRLDPGVRRAVRKSQSAGVQVEMTHSSEALRIFYYLHCRTRQKHCLPPQPLLFFKKIYDHILSSRRGFIAIASFHLRPVAAAIFFHMRDQAIYKFGASDERCQNLRGNNLVMWEAIRWYARNGFRKLHFGRTSLSNDGLRRFKLGWGTEESQLEYIKYDLRNNEYVIDQDRVCGWHNRFFEKLPLPLSRMIGTLVYRHLG